LGERHDMDITIEGFHSWMWKGLTFLLPFLFGGYAFQFYNGYRLYQLSKLPDAPWQVSVLSVLFFMLFIGNTWTTSMVIPQKLNDKLKEGYRLKSMSRAMKIREQIKVGNLKFLIFNLNKLSS
jgi:D-alanyl-lipoteichoic acid acyltransferase DltB (MBOAT superfamily)